jgi:1-phosphofructokinase
MAKIAGVGEGDFVILSGGLLPGMPVDTYARILDALANTGARMVVDATGETLTRALPYKPFLIKPNDEELAEICGCDENDVDALIADLKANPMAGKTILVKGSNGNHLDKVVEWL